MERRLTLEYNDIQKEIAANGDDNFYSVTRTASKMWTVEYFRMLDTPYENGRFKMEINFPDGYPFKHPNVRFLTKIFHPNISSTGIVCSQLLTPENWTPSITVKFIILDIYELLIEPNCTNPINPDIAQLYIKNIEEFENEAKSWTKAYAM